MTEAAGVPETVGTPFGAATLMANAGRLVLALPSETEMTMPPKDSPAMLLVGVPDRRPVDALKLAQLGAFTTENVSALPSASDAEGWKL